MNQDLLFKLAAKTQGEKDLAEFEKRLKGIENNTKSMAKGFSAANTFIKTFVTGFLIKQGADFAKNIINIADGLQELSQKTGISVDALSGYQEAAKQSGLSTEGLETQLRKFSVSLAEARNGNAAVSAAFKNLGISADELKSKTPDQLIKRLADNFVGLKDGPEKAANAVKIFGKAGTDMIPFLNEGADSLSKFSLGLSDDFARRADKFNDTISAMGSSLKRTFAGGLETLLPTLQDILDQFNKFPSVGVDMKSIFETIGEVTRLAAVGISAVATELIDFGDDIIKTGRETKAFLTGNFSEVDQLEADYQKRHESRMKASQAREEALLKNSRLFGEGSIDVIRSREASSTSSPARVRGGKSVSAEGINAGERDRVKEFLALRQQENDQLKASLDDYRLSAVELDKVKAARKLDNEALQASKGLNKDQQAALAAGTEEIKLQREALIDLQYEQQRTFSYGAHKAFQDYVESASNAAKNAQELFGKMFSGMEDALTEFVKTGSLNFQKFADSIIEELIRITIRQQVIAPLVGGLGGLFTGGGAAAGAGGSIGGSIGGAFADGGVMTSRGRMRLNKYANGGVANSPQLAMFGEGRRPEAYVPLPDGRSIPVNMKGAGGDVSVMVNVNSDTGATDSKSSSESGKQLGTLIGNAVKSEIIKQKRPGGLLAG